MRIVSHRKLEEFYSSSGHADAESALEQWYEVAEKKITIGHIFIRFVGTHAEYDKIDVSTI